MTPNMSLEKWETAGQLSRELNYYEELTRKATMRLTVFSYGRNDSQYEKENLVVLGMPQWIPLSIPFRVQNLIYSIYALLFYRKQFRKVLLSKTNQFPSANFGMLLKIFYSIPLIIRMGFYNTHLQEVSFARKVTERIAFKFSNFIFTTSKEAADFIVQSYKIPKSKILTILNSVNLEKFKPLSLPKKWDCITVGRLENIKNIDLLLQVFMKMSGRCLIIGKGSREKSVKQAIDQNDDLQWIQRVDNDDLPQYYNSSKCFVLLSEFEGNPKVLLEAMACGTSCVGTDVPGIRECITDNFNGLLVTKDAQSIVNKINHLISNQNEKERLALNGVKWVNENCNYFLNIEKEIEVYSRILKRA
jgi:glycosyltransferase involved in cell wall biosynthesis